MIYFDVAATDKPTEAAFQAFTEATFKHFGNSNSTHGIGFDALRVLDHSRQSVLKLLDLDEGFDLIFTSGATESNNVILHGIAHRYKNRGMRILTSAVEHPSVLSPLERLAEEGYDVVRLPVNSSGFVEPETLEEAMDKNTILVSLMAVNNETGAIFPVERYAEILKKFPKAFLHIDATQAVGKTAQCFKNVDALSFSGHKIGAPKGTGVLVYHRTIRLLSPLQGGEQERGLVPGTVNVPGAVALETALREKVEHRAENEIKMRGLMAYLKENLASIPELVFNSPENGSPYVLNCSLLEHKASVVVEALSQKEIYISSVSACSTHNEAISHVLLAMGKSEIEAGNSLRISMPLYTTKEEIEQFVSTLKTILKETHPR
ncbi:MAG: cysteine desulfurase [Bacilli bacterium]|nr:cysteine desulfurase [Bacilli bacterium]